MKSYLFTLTVILYVNFKYSFSQNDRYFADSWIYAWSWRELEVLGPSSASAALGAIQTGVHPGATMSSTSLICQMWDPTRMSPFQLRHSMDVCLFISQIENVIFWPFCQRRRFSQHCPGNFISETGWGLDFGAPPSIPTTKWVDLLRTHVFAACW